MFQEAVERFHQLDHCDIRAGVDELVIGVGSVGPAPRVSERVELRVTPEQPVEFTLRIRIPAWSPGARLMLNGTPVAVRPLHNIDPLAYLG